MRHKTLFIIVAVLLLGGVAETQYNVPPTTGCPSGNAVRWSGSSWNCETASGGTAIPSGLITFVISGTCPAGWSEVTALNGKAIYGTLAANADVGGAVGADTITPTVNSLTAAAQVFTGSSTTVPAETVNSLTAAAQTVNSLTAAAQVISWPAGGPTAAGEAAHTHGAGTYQAAAQAFTGNASTVVVNHTHTLPFARGATTGGATTTQGFTTSTDTSSTAITDVTSNPSGGAANYTPAGTNAASAISGTSGAGSSHTHTLSWPAGVPTNAASAVTGTMNSSAVTGTLNSTTITPLGSNAASAVTGTLNSFNNRPAGIKAIFCSKD